MNLFEGQYNFQNELDMAGSREDAKKKEAEETNSEKTAFSDPAARLEAYEKKVFPEANPDKKIIADEYASKIINEIEERKNKISISEKTNKEAENTALKKADPDELDDPGDEYYGRFNRIREGELLRKKQEEASRLKQKNYKPFPKYKK